MGFRSMAIKEVLDEYAGRDPGEAGIELFPVHGRENLGSRRSRKRGIGLKERSGTGRNVMDWTG